MENRDLVKKRPEELDGTSVQWIVSLGILARSGETEQAVFTRSTLSLMRYSQFSKRQSIAEPVELAEQNDHKNASVS
jgi:hypothetical protein